MKKLILISLIIIFGCTPKPTPTEAPTPTPDPKGQAWGACQQIVLEYLKAPSTAKFKDYSEDQVTNNFGTTYLVLMQVDAENSFGAMIRNNIDCTVKFDKGIWNLISIHFK